MVMNKVSDSLLTMGKITSPRVNCYLKVSLKGRYKFFFMQNGRESSPPKYYNITCEHVFVAFDLVVVQGVETERRVLVTTAESLIQPYQCVREVQPPDRKKMREEEPGSHDHNMTLPRAHFISYQVMVIDDRT